MIMTVPAIISGQQHRQVGVGAERLEGLLRPVGGRRQPVRAEADPGEKRDERDVMEDPRDPWDRAPFRRGWS